MEASIKVVVVGDGSVGKTCLLLSYSQNTFPEEYVPTVFDNHTANVMWHNRTVQLQLWDTAGQEDYDKLRPLSYPETDVFILCYDVTSRTSFDNIANKWVREIRHYCPNTPLILCGTKADLKDNLEYMRELERQGKQIVTPDMGRRAAQELGFVDYVECSARTQRGLKALFDKCIEAVLLPQMQLEKKSKGKRKYFSHKCKFM